MPAVSWQHAAGIWEARGIGAGGDKLQERAAGPGRGVVLVRNRQPVECTSTRQQRRLVLEVVPGPGDRGVEVQEVNW
jgi:hypothetical protein